MSAELVTSDAIGLAQVAPLSRRDFTAASAAAFKIYPGAPHGFHADDRASYRREAAEGAWSRMRAGFKQYKVLG